MIDKGERFFDGTYGADIGRLLALDHDNLDAKPTRRRDLAVGRLAAAVLGDDDLDLVVHQKLPFRLFLERAGSEQVTRMGNAKRRCNRIDTADQIVVLRRAFEVESLLPADREEDASRRFAQRPGCFGNRGNADPAVARLPFPAGTSQCEEGDFGSLRRHRRVLRNPSREGMRRVDHQVEFFRLEEFGKAVAAAEAAAAHGYRLGQGLRRPSGQRQQQVAIRAIRQGRRQVPRFGRSAENQDAVFAHV